MRDCMYCHTGITEIDGHWEHTGTPPMRTTEDGTVVLVAGGPDGHDAAPWMGELRAQCARDARDGGHDESYWRYLDDSSVGTHAYFTESGQPEMAAEMLTRSLGAALMGNDGD